MSCRGSKGDGSPREGVRRARARVACRRRPTAYALAALLATLAGSRGLAQVFGPPAPLNDYAASDTARDETPQIAMDGAGTWVAVWASTQNLGGAIGGDWDILFARSTDAGASWSAPAPLNNNAASDSAIFDLDPQIATDGAGTWVAVWSNDQPPFTATRFARSTDGGASWSDPANIWDYDIPLYRGEDFSPQIAAGEAGNWVVVFQLWGNSEMCDYPEPPLFDDCIVSSQSTDGGVTWSWPWLIAQHYAFPVYPSYLPRFAEPQITTDGAGTWVAAWNDFGAGAVAGIDGNILFARSTDGGAHWSAPAPLNNDATSATGYDRRMDITTDGAGTWTAVWSSAENLGGTGTDEDILFAQSTDGGISWSAPAALNTNGASDTGFDREPQLTTDGAGNWVAVWKSDEDLDGIGTDEDILFARSTDGGASWSAPAALNTNAASDTGADRYARLATDGAGAWLAVWESRDDLGGSIGTDEDILFAAGADPPPPGPKLFEASLILHDFTTLFRGFFTPTASSAFVARPLGASCFNFFGCGAATLTQGAPLTGTGSAKASGGFPAMFTLPGGELRAVATGWLPVLAPFDFAGTTVTASNQAGSFYPGGGPGSLTEMVVPTIYGVRSAVAIHAGPRQFGGVMRLLGSMRSTRRHLNPYGKGGFQGAGADLFSVLGGDCNLTTTAYSLCNRSWGSLGTATFLYSRPVKGSPNETTMAYRFAHGWAWTTGTVTATASNGNGNNIVLKRAGYDNRTPFGAYGTIQLVAPQLARWEFPGRIGAPWDRSSVTIGVLKLRFVPEPAGWMLLTMGGLVLCALHRRVRRH